MFEKEAEEYTVENVCSSCYFEKPCENKCEAFGCADSKTYVLKAFKDGAEFGYNKANEWHYMKDVQCYEDLHFPPKEEKGRVLIWKVQVITEKGVKKPVCYHCGSYDDLWYEMNAYHVIAWKEIVPPKEIE